MSLELKDVEKKVGIETHIHSTNLKLEKNTINVLLGSTLAGKTTLMQIMAGLDKPTTGEIWFNGENVTGKEVQKRNCSMVYQQFINYPNFSVYENIASPLKITGVNPAEIKERVGKVAELLKLSAMLNKKPDELSGGQQQRTALARTLVKDSAISLSTVLKLIVKLKIGSPPTILFVRPPSIDFNIDGTPGKQNTFSTLKPGAPLVGFKIKFAFSGIQTIFCLPSLNSPGL